MKNGILGACPEVLSWQESTLLHSSLLISHRDFLRTRFERALAAFVKAGVGDRLARLSDALPTHALDRLITAPDSAWRLVYGREKDLLFFVESVQAEHYRTGGAGSIRRGVWTALGDHYYPAGYLKPDNPLHYSSLAWNDESYFRAPCLTNGIVVDYTSSHAERFLRLAKLPLGSIQPLALSKIIRKLEGARALVELVSEHAYELISSHTQSILVWNDTSRNSEHFSLSNPRWPGRIGFSNVEYDHTDTVALADSMIHESIHAFFHRIEEVSPFLNPDGADLGVTVSSPWTGRILHIHSFLHACYVWFALWQFWLRASSCRTSAPGDRIQQMIDRSRIGFFSPSMDYALTATRPYLSTEGQSVFAFVRDVQGGVYD
ncbi:MAG TPA: HEXXH motif-containing putative peptide modification protein [Pseudonocardiaceae bacterium]|nr:HEXXH motif-containing putative peptide modification protein [Pseudonocardiaceae bacterium]